ncbi:ester cyclase [Gillisia sp. Q332]|uniref:ester cyclase n=1 Tax=Gillisia xinjiangensis TaxID=3384765 RepID=UPI00391B065D
MKTATLFLALSFLSIPNIFAQQSQVENNIKTYKTTWDNVINKGQIDQINAKNFDENIVMIASPENIVGIDAFKAYYQNFLTGFSDIKFTVVEILGSEDKIVKHFNFKGKHTGDFFGIPPTGKTVDLSGVTIAKMKNGKIAQEQDFFDNMLFMQQLGLVSNPENLDIVDNLYKAFSTGDIPSVLGALDEKVVWNEAEGNAYADGNPYIGPDAVLNGVFARVGEEHEYFTLENIQLHEMSDNKVLATLRYDGKVKETGKTYNAQVAHLWTLKDGKVVGFQQYVDTKQLADASSK